MKNTAKILPDGSADGKVCLNRPASASLALTLTSLISKGCALIFTPIFTRILSADDYGSYSLFTSCLSVLVVLGTLELSGSVILRAFQKNRKAVNITVLSASALTAVTSAAVVAVFIIIRGALGGESFFPYSDLFLFVMCVATSIINVYSSKCRFLYQKGAVIASAAVQSVAIPLLSIIALRIRALDGINHVTIKIGIASAVMLMLALGLIIRAAVGALGEIKRSELGKGEVAELALSSVRTMLRLALPMLPYYLSVMLIAQGNRMIIDGAFGKETVAVYSVAYSLGIAMSAVSSGITSVLCPWIMRKVRAGSFDVIRAATDTLISLSSAALIAFLSLCPELLRLIAPASYFSGLPAVFLISVCPILLSLCSVMSSVAVAKERVGGVVLSGVLPAALGALANILFVARLGIVFTAAVTLASYLSVLIIQNVNTKIICRTPLLSEKRSLGILAAVIASGAVIYALRGMLLPRLLILAASLAVLAILAKKSLWIIRDKQNEQE